MKADKTCGAAIPAGPNSPLLRPGDTKVTMLLAIGERLRETFPASAAAMPEDLQSLLQRLVAATDGDPRAGEA